MLTRILLWEPSFPERAPTRLTVDDAIASVAVRAGVAAAANPAEAGRLLIGGALSSATPTPTALQHGAGEQKVITVMLPAAVASVAIALGLASAASAPSGAAPAPVFTTQPSISIS